MIIYRRLRITLAWLEIRFMLWYFFRHHSAAEFKWRLKKAGFRPVQSGPNAWRWVDPVGKWSIYLVETEVSRP